LVDDLVLLHDGLILMQQLGVNLRMLEGQLMLVCLLGSGSLDWRCSIGCGWFHRILLEPRRCRLVTLFFLFFKKDFIKLVYWFNYLKFLGFSLHYLRLSFHLFNLSRHSLISCNLVVFIEIEVACLNSDRADDLSTLGCGSFLSGD
jgi:hypothetical protein